MIGELRVPLVEIVGEIVPAPTEQERAEGAQVLAGLIHGGLLAALVIAERPDGEYVEPEYDRGAAAMLRSLLYIGERTDAGLDLDRVRRALARQERRTGAGAENGGAS